ncbi:MAG: hypothetical protein FWD71_22600 [Oscillospiraceae bacterium]|nr:hypothetical protein [Oscillospiraceae bacterium]
MSNEKEKFYKNEDYVVRMKKIDGIEKYFIKFNMTDSPENEISLDIFNLYFFDDDLRKPLDKQRNESRRHIADEDFEYLILSKKLMNYTAEDEDRAIIKYDIEAALKTCTPVQQRRFKLYYFQDYTYEKIARLENCDYSSVKESINATVKKIKKYFFDTP